MAINHSALVWRNREILDMLLCFSYYSVQDKVFLYLEYLCLDLPNEIKRLGEVRRKNVFVGGVQLEIEKREERKRSVSRSLAWAGLPPGSQQQQGRKETGMLECLDSFQICKYLGFCRSPQGGIFCFLITSRNPRLVWVGRTPKPSQCPPAMAGTTPPVPGAPSVQPGLGHCQGSRGKW